MDTEMQDSLDELRGSIRNLEEIREEMKKIQKEVDKVQKESNTKELALEKMQEEVAKMQEEVKKKLHLSMKTLERLNKNMEEVKTMQDELNQDMDDLSQNMKEHWEMRKEHEDTRDAIKQNMDKLNEYMIDLKKNKETFETMELELIQMREEIEKLQNELFTKQSELNELHLKQEKQQEESKIRQTAMQNALLAVNELRILQYVFIDAQIKSRLESGVKEIYISDGDRLLYLESIVSDAMDDVRLLVLERLVRESGNNMLSVCKLCNDPTMKVISTKNSLQKHLMGSAKAVKLDSKTSQQILDYTNVLKVPGAVLESEILELTCPYSSSDSVTTAVKITAKAEYASVFDYQVVIKSNKGWKMIPAEYEEGYVKFPFGRIKYLFVISSEKWIPNTLSPEGLKYKSVDVKNVAIIFPPCCVDNKSEIQIQVVPPNPIEQSASQDQDEDTDLDADTDIVSVSPRIWVKHKGVLIFQKPIVVTLPLPSAPPTEKDTDLSVVKWTDDDDMHISDTNICVKENVCEFEVDDISGVSLLRWKRLSSNRRLKPDIGRYYTRERGLSKECKILTFSDMTAVNTLQIEIVESIKVDQLISKLEQQQMNPIANTISPTIAFRNGQIIKIFARGSIRIHSDYQLDHMQIKFTAKEDNNYKRFNVELIDANSSALLKFQLGGKQVHFCNFEAKAWLKQRGGTFQPKTDGESQSNPHTAANKTLHLKSMQELARQIPIQRAEELATELNLSDNEVADLKAHGSKGIQLTFQVLLKWRQKWGKEATEMINDLTAALNALSLNSLSSKLMKASMERRSLVKEDFVE